MLSFDNICTVLCRFSKRLSCLCSSYFLHNTKKNTNHFVFLFHLLAYLCTVIALKLIINKEYVNSAMRSRKHPRKIIIVSKMKTKQKIFYLLTQVMLMHYFCKYYITLSISDRKGRLFLLPYPHSK